MSVVRELRLRMLSATPTAFDVDYETAFRLDKAAWLEWIGAGDGDQQSAVWIAELDGTPVGTVAASIVADDCRIGALWVAPDYRRAGVGGQLLDAAETWCHDAGCRWNVLSVAEVNLEAQRLYLRRGYELTGSSKPTRWEHRELHTRKPAGH